MFTKALEIAESERLSILDSYGMYGVGESGYFTQIVGNVARKLGAPIAVVSLAGADSLWFKARVGIATRQVGIEFALAAETRNGPATVAIEDASQDKRFCDLPQVVNEPYVRAFLGAPLVNPEGVWLGALSVVDIRPRSFSEAEQRYIEGAARKVVVHMEMQRLKRQIGHYSVMDQLVDRVKAAEVRGALEWGRTLIDLIYAAGDEMLRDEA